MHENVRIAVAHSELLRKEVDAGTPAAVALIGRVAGLGLIALACGGEVADDGGVAAGGRGNDSAGNTGGGGNGGSDASERAPCVPYDDQCPAGQYCQLWEGRLRCVAEGAALRDEDCGADRCQRGSICLWGSDIYGDLCQQPCTLDGVVACDLSRHTCFVATDAEGAELDFGVCRY